MVEQSPSERRLRKLRKSIKKFIAYPPNGHPRRTNDGYPEEFTYDEYAYKRMVDSFREALTKVLKESYK